MTNTTVLVVGGGLNGLTAAALLAHNDIACVLVERHPDTLIQYKFAGISPRSMEIFRSLGLEEEIRTNRTGDQQAGAIARARNLADPEIQWGGPAWPDASALSPTQPATCDQHVLEPILRRYAERNGADVRFSTELVTFDEDETVVRAEIRDIATYAKEVISADYLIVADGANGSLRERLEISRSGAGGLQHWMNVVFDMDMPPTIGGKRFTSCFVTDLNGTFTPREGGRWLLALQYFPEKGEKPQDFDECKCRELIIRGAGRSDITTRLVDARSWEVAALTARQFRRGRAFLVGDAAHVMPPTGAFGGNSGIHDAHNLAWKLAMVARGHADPSLLDSYDMERRPVIEATLAQALARLQKWFDDPSKRLPPPVAIVEDYDVVFGQRYTAGIVARESTPDDHPFQKSAELSGRPGTRLPHFAVGRAGQRISSLDLCDRDLLLLCADEAWCQAADAVSQRLRMPLTCHALGANEDLIDLDHRWPSALGVESGGAVLVRPDGFVAWRSSHGVPDPVQVLIETLDGFGFRTQAHEHHR
ncbi:FAD-dependent monooxygenase [Mesorhizobium sp. M0040]|uniref:FAD-dependent monooxygenase n=1 Tax=Mesorhizobium sp. M0040 TaxID=2956855 RepID=UPI003337B34E